MTEVREREGKKSGNKDERKRMPLKMPISRLTAFPHCVFSYCHQLYSVYIPFRFQFKFINKIMIIYG